MYKKINYAVIAFVLCLTVGVISAFSGETVGHKDHGNIEKKVVSDDYPLDICPVTGAKLGSMDKTVVYVHDGQEIRLCCYGCLDVVKNDPEKYVKIIADAKKKNHQ